MQEENTPLIAMEKLTHKEEELMRYFWAHGPFSRQTLGGVIRKYFENSYLGAVSALVEEEKISVEELRGLIDRIERENSR